MKLQALREKRKTLAIAVRQQADRMNADGYTPSAEDHVNWEAVNKDYNTCLAAIEREETAGLIESATNSPDHSRRIGNGLVAGDVRARGHDGGAATDAMRSMALTGWIRAQLDRDVTEEQAEAARLTRINPFARSLTFNLTQDREAYSGLQRAMTGVHSTRSHKAGLDYMATLGTGSGTSGGFLVPPVTMLRQLEVNMLAYGGLLQVAETITTSSGERMSWPTADDTTNKGVRLGQSTTIGASVDPTFGQVFWDAYKYSSKPVLVPYELIEDSQAANVPELLGQLLGIRLGRIANDECTTGTGNSMPKGIVTAAGAGYTSSKVAKIVADDLMNLEHKVDPAYRSMPGVGYMMHDLILLQIRLLKDGDGQYLYKSGASFGAPDTVNGYGITINQSMQSTLVSGKTAMLFGHLPSYKVRRVNGVRMYRLEERYRDTDQDGFIALLRLDGNLLTAGTNPVQPLVLA